MKTRIFSLAALLVFSAGCKGKGEAKTAVPPDNIGREQQIPPNPRARAPLNFLDRSHDMREIVPTQGMDQRIVEAQLITEAGRRRASYRLKLIVVDYYGREFSIKQRGKIVATGGTGALQLYGVNSMGMPAVIGQLTPVISTSTNEQCAHLRVYLGQFLGESRLLLCEDASNRGYNDDYDSDEDDRDNRRRRR